MAWIEEEVMDESRYNPMTHTYDTQDGTKLAAELVDNVQSLVDIFWICCIREKQRDAASEEVMAGYPISRYAHERITKEVVEATYKATKKVFYESGYAAGKAEGIKEGMRRAAEMCNAADKSTHPADLADAIIKEAGK